jgi:Rrf2 family protein
LHREQVATAREIAGRYRVPAALLMNVLKALAQHGLVRSSRGRKGGYELARPPERVTLNEIVEAIEGPVRFVPCAAVDEVHPHEGCDLIRICPVSAPVRRLHHRLKGFFDEVTLAQIAFDADCGCRPAVAVGLAMAGSGDMR